MKNNAIKEFALYVIVGGIATLSEWAVFYILNICNMHYMLATFIAYMLSTLVNWMAGRVLIFKQSKTNVLKEIVEIYIAGVIGLLLNLLIMFIAVKLFNLDEMISKVVATGLVFVYNFLIRKLVIYK